MLASDERYKAELPRDTGAEAAAELVESWMRERANTEAEDPDLTWEKYLKEANR